MSLAFNAAPISFNEESNKYGNIIDSKKRMMQNNSRSNNGNASNRNASNRNANNGNANNVNSMMQAIHDGSSDDEHIGNFNPPPNPTSMGTERTHREAFENEDTSNEQYSKKQDVKQNDSDVGVGDYNNLSNNYANDYYNQYVPYFNRMSPEKIGSRDELLEKLNYMIHLLEDQQDIKTGHITEELILYSFLGIFIIFVLDSFARTGKYVR